MIGDTARNALRSAAREWGRAVSTAEAQAEIGPGYSPETVEKMRTRLVDIRRDALRRMIDYAEIFLPPDEIRTTLREELGEGETRVLMGDR